MSSDAALVEEDALRADVWLLFGALLAQTPSADLLQRLGTIEVPDEVAPNTLDAAWGALAAASRTSNLQELDDAFHRLFIGVGRGELLPYGSYYRTGYLMDRPLSELRSDLVMLGFKRRENVHEPEDHLSALSDAMAFLIQEQGLAMQQRFYQAHLASWVGRFFDDLEQHAQNEFYCAFARLGQRFMALENRYLAMPVRGD